MSTLAPEAKVALATAVRVAQGSLVVELTDGRTISVPLNWYPRLLHAKPFELAEWRLMGGGSGIHWPSLEEDISVEGLFAGHCSQEQAASLSRWLAKRGN